MDTVIDLSNPVAISALTQSNHVYSGRLTEGNCLYNDGHVEWVPMKRLTYSTGGTFWTPQPK